MILNCGVFAQWRPRSPTTQTVCLASPSASATADQLRQQLDNLHKEADSTRAKANNARLRLMRLSEAVDKLRRQATISIQTGKENDARDMLFQKKKVMQTMEKLKTRIELFDELSAKLNEAISMKESLLIGNMALDLDVTNVGAPGHVRIVSPSSEISNNTDDNQNDPDFEEDQNLGGYAESQANIEGEIKLSNNDKFSDESGSSNVGDSVNGPKEISTYEDFVQHLDQQLSEIEQELAAFLRYSSLLLDNKEKAKFSKVQQAADVLEDIRRARNRIASEKQTRLNSDEVSL